MEYGDPICLLFSWSSRHQVDRLIVHYNSWCVKSRLINWFHFEPNRFSCVKPKAIKIRSLACWHSTHTYNEALLQKSYCVIVNRLFHWLKFFNFKVIFNFHAYSRRKISRLGQSTKYENLSSICLYRLEVWWKFSFNSRSTSWPLKILLNKATLFKI